jgi:hypothetical protein
MLVELDQHGAHHTYYYVWLKTFCLAYLKADGSFVAQAGLGWVAISPHLQTQFWHPTILVLRDCDIALGFCIL